MDRGVRGKGIHRTVYSFCTLPPNYYIIIKLNLLLHFFITFLLFRALRTDKLVSVPPLNLNKVLIFYNFLLFSLFYNFYI